MKIALYDEEFDLVAVYTAEQFAKAVISSWTTKTTSFWWRAICAGINQLLSKSCVDPKDIVAVGCCAHLHGSVVISQNDELAMIKEKDTCYR